VQKRGKSLWLVYFSLILLLIPVTVYKLSSSQNNNSPEKVLSAIAEKTDLVKESELEKIAEEQLLNKKGDYSIVIKNLQTDEFYSHNSDKQYNSASLYKLWIMAVVFQKIKDGSLKEDETLSAEISKLNDTLSTTSPTPTPENFTPTPTLGEPERVSMRAGFAIENMITISDNFSAILLASRSGNFSVTNFLKNYEFNNSNFRQPPQTTAGDIALFYEKLYKGGIVDEYYSNRMIEILKKQTLNDRIPKYLPKDVEVAHKTGELFDAKHDAGIVYSPHGDYIIVVLSKTNNPQEASENIAKFSKAVYEYFAKN
jgi:beta-lactamase class A